MNVLEGYISASVENARFVDQPFFHLEFDRVFPADVYDTMMEAF